ncbi:MAG: RES family NAD+ phosphorylase, partial [Rudanella sp.]|nr:RES family NAD+ phosphorylase [Rudanella sp.]
KITLNQNAFSVATIYIPDTSIHIITANDLPSDWETEDDSLFDITDKWISNKTYLVMQVPSAVIGNECNYLINPAHPLFPEIRLESVALFQFDKRAFGKVLLKKP